MSTSDSDGPERLRREILEEARRQRDDLLKQARTSADRLLFQAEQEAKEAAGCQLKEARADAQRRHESLLSTVAIETNRLELVQTEALLDSIRDEALAQVRQGTGFDRRDTLIGLALDALAKMSGDRFKLNLSRADLQAFGAGLSAQIQHRWAGPPLTLEVSEDAQIKEGHWILEDANGRQSWDLTLEARLERLWPELRRQIVAQAGLVSQEMAKEAEG